MQIFHFPSCGSGLSWETLTEHGDQWLGLDISESMLGIFDLAMIIIRLLNDGFILDIALEREVEGDLMLGDMGQGFDLVF